VAFLFGTVPSRADTPTITTQPQKRTVVEGSSHTFSVTAAGTAPLFYQWRRDASTLTGQTNSTLPLSSITTNDAGGYSVVVTNAEGATTSLVAQLTVRLAGDPVYPAPQGGWAYFYDGAGVSNDPMAALDGTWNFQNGGWSGDGRGSGNGLAGGLSTTNGILTIEDALTSGTGFNNQRYYFTHNLAQETGVTNATTLLNDGVTLTFRARLTPPTDPLLEITNAPNGLVNNTDGKGIFGLRQAGSSGMLISFSLGQASEDTNATGFFNFAQAGLHMNNLNGNTRSAAVDPGEGGATNLLALDPSVFHEFWITIQDNGAEAGTHRVSVYLDGGKTPTIFNVTSGTGSDGPATNYLALGLGTLSAQRGAVDVDFLGYQSGIILPSAFNEPVGIVTQPASQFVVEGQMAAFNVGVTGTPPYSFQWYRDGAVITGATNASYTTAPVTSGDAGAQFVVVVANDCNSVTSSPPAALQLLDAPTITTQPASLTITNGDPASFTVVASSPVTPTYQWRFNGGNLSGQTNATLTLGSATAANAGNYDVVVANGSGSVTSTVAVLTVVLCDYGDAPDPAFPTLRASNGAAHRIVPGIYLGGAIDTETDGQPNAGASGDDDNGTDDDEGVQFLTPLLAGQSATVQVVASTNAFLNAWLDFDRNGSWSGAGEQIFTNAPLVGGTNSLAFGVPAAASTGTSYARFRFDTTGGLSFSGPAADGEVEDYAVALLPVADLVVTQAAAPDPVAINATLNFVITVSNAGPSAASGVVTTNVLPPGVTFQSVVVSQGSCLLVAGELSCDLGALANSAIATVTVAVKPTSAGSVTNTVRVSSAAADFTAANNTASATASALAPPAIITQPQNLTVTNGSAATFTVTASGAATLRYQWRFNGEDLNGATNAALTLPAAQLADAGGYSVRVTNQVGSATSVVATLTVLVPPSISTPPQSQTNLAGGTANLTVGAAGTAPLSYQWLFNNANLAGQTASTLTLANLQLTNAGNYAVVVSNPAGVTTSAVATLTVIAMDFGDAPDSYRTFLGTNGARHRVVPAIRLGAAVDFEPDGQPDTGAGGDDAAGTDDEDGITFTTPIRAGQIVSLTAVASSNGVLNAWLDYNRNGSWADAGEQILVNRLLPGGTNIVNFTAPGHVSAGLSYARFRFSTLTNLSFDGEAPSGEVEDYAVTLEAVSDLAITRLTQLSPIGTGSNQIYTITVSNAGPSAATGVSLTDTLAAGVSFVSAVSSQGGCSHSAGIILCSLGEMNPGDTVSIQIEAIPLTAGSLTNTVTVGGNQLDLNTANNNALAVATVQDQPVIQLQPQSQIVTNGGTAMFSVTASGTALSYQWLLNGVPVAGGTNTTLTLSNAQPAQAGSYTVRVTNLVGAVLSSPATLTVLGPVTITTQPQSQTVLSGTTVTFTVTASGTPPLSYQWEFEGAELAGQTGASLVLSGVQTNQSGAYRVRVTNPVGSVNSDVATLTVLELPVFLVQPQSATNTAGSTARLTALAAGTTPLSYQWFLNQTTRLAGQTNATLQFTNAQTSHSGAYTVTASNIAGVRTSAVAVLTIYEVDFGDAPESLGYPTTLAFDGARHRLLPGVRLGSLADFETNGRPNLNADGDDLAGLDDEDGVLFPTALLVGQTSLVPVIASTNGFLDAWIDFNGNGSWGDPGEQVLASRPLAPGTNSLPFGISPAAVPGLRHVRCRFSSLGGLGPAGFAADGEVEDYRVTLSPAVDLAIGLEDLGDPVGVSSNLMYLMSVTNRGPSTATSVMLTNYLPPSYTYIEAVPSQGYCGDIGTNTVFCPVDSIAPGGVVTMVLTVRPNAPGTFTNIALAAASEAELSPADNLATQSTSVILPPTSYTNAVALPVADATFSGPGLGSPYPSTILVSGLTSAVFKVTVRLNYLNHPLSKDFDVLLVGPRGQSALLMSDAGAGSLGGVTLTFDDAAEVALPSTGVIAAGVYRPSNYGAALDVFPPPAPPGPWASSLSGFIGTDPNGPWSLYVVDGIVGGSGSIAGGWNLTISTADPIADLALGGSVNGIDLTIPLTDPIKVPVNSNLVYTFTVTNKGPAVASNTVLTNTLPAGVAFVSATSTAGTCSQQGGLVTCTLSDLSAGDGAVITLTVRPTTVGLLTNTARVSGSRLDQVPADNLLETTVASRTVTDLTVVQTASTNVLLLGEQITYTLNVTNRGPNPATNIRLTDQLPDTFNFVSVSTTQGACSNAAGVLTCDLATLASGARAQVTILASSTLLGTVTNRALITSDEVDLQPTNNATQLSTVVNVAADLSLSVTTSVDGIDVPSPPANPMLVAVGSVIAYNYVVTNRGPGFAYEVQLTDSLPAGLAYLSAVAPDGICDFSNGAVRCALGIVTPGNSTTVTIFLTPTTAARLTNTVTLTTSSIDPVSSNNLAAVVADTAFPPVILVQPQDRAVTNGTPASFTVTAGPSSGTNNGVGLRYQWFFTPSGPPTTRPAGPQPNQTNATLTIPATQLGDAGDYYVEVTNLVGRLLSNPARLRVLAPPTISDVADVQIDEDTPTPLLAVTVGDPDTHPSALTLTATSTDAALVPISNIFLGGSASNRTVQILPATNRFGTVTIMLQVRDPDGLIATDTLLLTVRPVNDPPSLSDLLNRTMLEDTVLAIPFTVSDPETPPDLLSLAIASSNTNLLPPARLTLSGTGTNRLLLLQPAADQSGVATLTLTCTDTNPASTSRQFQVTVAAVNDPPTLNPPANLALNQDAGPQTVTLTGISSGAPNEIQTLNLSAVSSNPALIPNPTVAYSSPDSTGTLQFSPVPGTHGTTLITVTVTDNGASNNVVTRPFTVTVNARPVLASIPDQVINEDGLATVSVVVTDAETPAGSLNLAVTCSDTNLVAASGVTLGGSGSNRVVTLRPVTNAFGSATISVSVTDGGGATATRNFQLAVLPVNDLPEASTIPDQTLDENTASPAIPFTVSDAETAAADLTVTASTSNTNLFPLTGGPSNPPAGITLGGTGTNRWIALQPATDQFGTATIVLTVRDTDAATTSRSFLLTVRPIVFPPTITSPPQSRTVTNGGTATFTVAASGTPPLSYQWHFTPSGPQASRPAGLQAGETNATFTIPSTQPGDAGDFHVVVSNIRGQQASAPARLRVLVSPTITAIVRTDSNAQISFSSEAGLSYTVEFKNAPEAPGWSPLGPVTGTGGIMTVTDPTATMPSRIYRVRAE
jgi:uncharacterized repeat protein (TIGR01451 family)